MGTGNEGPSNLTLLTPCCELACFRPKPSADQSTPSGGAAAGGAAGSAAGAGGTRELAFAGVAEGGHEFLHFLALALRAGHLLVAEDEGFEGFFALLAAELKNRHMVSPSLFSIRPCASACLHGHDSCR